MATLLTIYDTIPCAPSEWMMLTCHASRKPERVPSKNTAFHGHSTVLFLPPPTARPQAFHLPRSFCLTTFNRLTLPFESTYTYLHATFGSPTHESGVLAEYDVKCSEGFLPGCRGGERRGGSGAKLWRGGISMVPQVTFCASRATSRAGPMADVPLLNFQPRAVYVNT